MLNHFLLSEFIKTYKLYMRWYVLVARFQGALTLKSQPSLIDILIIGAFTSKMGLHPTEHVQSTQ